MNRIKKAIRSELPSIIGTILLAMTWGIDTFWSDKIKEHSDRDALFQRVMDENKNQIIWLDMDLRLIRLNGNSFDAICENYAKKASTYYHFKHSAEIVIDDVSEEEQYEIDTNYRNSFSNVLKYQKDTSKLLELIKEGETYVRDKNLEASNAIIRHDIEDRNNLKKLKIWTIILLSIGTVLITLQKIISFFREKEKEESKMIDNLKRESPKKGETHRLHKK